MHQLDRRDFLRTAGTAAAAAVVFAAADAAARVGLADEMPIVDTHQHLWDLDHFRLAWIQPGQPLARNFSLEDYRAAVEGLNVVKTVYMEVDVVPEQHAAEAEYVLELFRQGDRLMAGAVISGRPASPGFGDYLQPFVDTGYIKGVREVLHGERTPAGYCLSRDFISGVRLLGELGMSFDLCMRPGELPDAGRLIDECPDTRFVLDHCGNADVQSDDLSAWERDIADVARRENVIGKVSGIVAGARPGMWTADDLAPVVNHTLDVFGPERVVFGGDWPVCTLAATFKEWVAALQQIVADRSAHEQRLLFHDNAVRFYELT